MFTFDSLLRRLLQLRYISNISIEYVITDHNDNHGAEKVLGDEIAADETEIFGYRWPNDGYRYVELHSVAATNGRHHGYLNHLSQSDKKKTLLITKSCVIH